MAIRAEDLDVVVLDAVPERSGVVDLDRDRLLVLRHQRGDVEAFDELYRRYHDRLVAYCLRRVGDRHVAEELAQDAFLKALRALPRFAGERRFYPWMTVIAQRLCIDHHRRSARVEPAAEIDGGVVEADHEAIWAQVDHGYLAEAMDRLAPRHREILELREERGWSYQQIAHHLDVPLTTVEALLHRARKALRREFLAVGGEDRRLTPLLPIAAGAGLLARVKAWIASLGPERVVPLFGTAAAGVAAVGLAVGPLTPGVAPVDLDLRNPAAAAVAATAAPSGAPGLGAVEVPAPASAVASAPVEVPVVAAVGDASPAAPALSAPGADVYLGPGGSAAAEERGSEMPINDELGPVGFGADPANLVEDADELIDVVVGATE